MKYLSHMHFLAVELRQRSVEAAMPNITPRSNSIVRYVDVQHFATIVCGGNRTTCGSWGFAWKRATVVRTNRCRHGSGMDTAK